ncbi:MULTISPECIES: sulfite exporter TauE/SafE family protein [unclassified Moorena]|uniref:urease accessory protein UreH domain-containing protein n=1 Tax=unclassified Moorena TaxID=2683338 RepID=UPI00140006AD|nr:MULTISPECIES: sulfite exporter TauE/SafE family protein [unclassified Moorena]NEO12299.1 sulfite exporter TauE/SafE family protein [Moorena sp. SIO3E8]NEP98942.1 sulfite exporter TauE/SafE family protein [Moorena sp. SIO3F7]
MVLDLLLVMTLGFLGSFGHCVAMCGPLAVAFSLSQQQEKSPKWLHQLGFHSLLNLGRTISYALVGAGLGGMGSVLIASGQLAGIGSGLRQAMAILTGLMLIWFGCVQLKPDWIPRLPLLHPLSKGIGNQRLTVAMTKLSGESQWWTPALLGGVWGLMPCGFLYAAQIKAAEMGNLWWGAATMLAFGLGTMPMMLGVGVSASRLSVSKRSQLFRLGGWVTLTIGILTLLRTDAMVDYTGHGALLLLMLALIARPISGLWAGLLRYRRALGVGAFVLAIAHTFHKLDHTLNWKLDALGFMLPQHQWGLLAGILALVLITPAALTSFDYLQKALGKRWRWIHLLSIPALVLAAIHTVMIGSSYLGELAWTGNQQLRAVSLGIITLGVLLVRSRIVWSGLSLEKFYLPPKSW